MNKVATLYVQTSRDTSLLEGSRSCLARDAYSGVSPGLQCQSIEQRHPFKLENIFPDTDSSIIIHPLFSDLARRQTKSASRDASQCELGNPCLFNE